MPRKFEPLPRDHLELQLGEIDLLMAMYEPEGAVSMDAESSYILKHIRSWCEGLDDEPLYKRETAISLVLNLSLDEHQEDTSVPFSIGLELSVPVSFCTQPEPEPEFFFNGPPKIKCRVQKPAWMSKAQATGLSDAIQEEEDVMAVIEKVKEVATNLLLESRLGKNDAAEGSARTDSEPLVRVWFLFPSISTRSKRDDLINYGPAYGLTGFLLAGKPGILCLEGGSRAIDEYMKFIKTESWGDIPSQHKKVSERHRETGPGTTRLFQNMQEITDMMGERRGERANRGDMKALEAWLEAHGIDPDVFGKVLF